MAPDKPSTEIIPFAKATEIKRLDANTYQANLVDSFCIGAVPNGGYVASCILQAAILHGSSRSTSNPQPHVMNAHFEYLNRTQVGPATIIIEDVKPGRQLTTLHATLSQGGGGPDNRGGGKKRLTAYLVMTNLSSMAGITLDTQFSLVPPPLTLSKPDFSSLLKQGGQDMDPNWTAIRLPPGFSYIRALQNTRFYIPRKGQVRKSIIDLWIRLASGERFTDATLGYVSDCWPYVVEAYRPRSEKEEESNKEGAAHAFRHDARHWYPTVVMNVEQKKAAPEKGWEWLRMRVSSKEVRAGRFDLEVLVMDEQGELVVVSNHVGLVLGSERNLAGRAQGGMKGQSRI
ncbi:thioesterase-like superfamily-domain-containing protein [Pseudoneurospora amorphoporcata]|uniref:Thioesterase-like superfamily-domain-containing protein n=1 Tax=Pseudoneurospora amorphoporcata TaxID=241081 RepID=A0AAN6SIM2_9PEZI|nr:thioesterase-like superfamily-domain-containing protein [Pseudoneurospora amorphoporcata]